MGFAAPRVKYAWGWGSTRTTKNLTEGVAAIKGTAPIFDPILEGTGGRELVRASAGVPDVSWRVGGSYHVAQARTLFTPSWVCKWLDALFEDTSVGIPTGYSRTYDIEDVPALPATFASLYKWTAKAENDVVQCLYGGIVRGFTIECSYLGAVYFTPDIAFAFVDEAVSGVSSSAAWDLPSTGTCTPVLTSELMVLFNDGSGLNQFYFVRSLSFTGSWESIPIFWDDQEPSRITRGKRKLTGQIEIRDIDDEVEKWNGYLKNGTTLFFALIKSGAVTFNLNLKLTGGGDVFEAGTRLGRYSFELISPTSGSYQYPFSISLTPGRA